MVCLICLILFDFTYLCLDDFSVLVMRVCFVKLWFCIGLDGIVVGCCFDYVLFPVFGCCYTG